MADIPPDFDKPWDMSDVVLRAQNSDGKPLHVSKTLLAIFSPYFRVLFFGNFKEKDQSEIEVDCEYKTLLEILRVIHHVNRSFARFGEKQYASESIVEMYTAADRFDFPLIRKMCVDQMVSNPDQKMAEAALILGLRKTLMTILTLANTQTIEAIMSSDDSRPLFSKKDLLLLYKMTASASLPMEPVSPEKALCLNLEEIVGEVKEPRIDLTKPWRMGDVAIFTENSLGRILYASRAAMELVCTNLEAKLSKIQEKEVKLEDIPEGAIVPEYQMNLNLEYTTMKQMLSIIHHCDLNIRGRDFKLHPALLFDMYREADEELDIPMIRQLCLNQLIDNPCPAALDVVLTLQIGDEFKESLLAVLCEDDLRSWLYNDKKLLSYMSCGKEMVLTTGSDEAVLSMKNIEYLVGKLRKKFFTTATTENQPVFGFGKLKPGVPITFGNRPQGFGSIHR